MSVEFFTEVELTDDLLRRFWAKVEKSDGCWKWKGEVSKQHGYGSFTIKVLPDGRKPRIVAHRLSWIIHFGPIPVALLVCHECDVRDCVRPDHLFTGTHADNTQDMIRKERKVILYGEDASNARFNEEIVREIRRERSAGVPCRVLAERFQTDTGHISRIATRKRWAHVK